MLVSIATQIQAELYSLLQSLNYDVPRERGLGGEEKKKRVSITKCHAYRLVMNLM